MRVSSLLCVSPELQEELVEIARESSPTAARRLARYHAEAVFGLDKEQAISVAKATRWLAVIRRDYGEGAFDWEVEQLVSQALPTVEEIVDNHLLREELERLLAQLNPQQAEALRLRVFEEKNYKEIGEQLGCSTEWARQLTARGLRRLRHPYMSRHLRDFI